MQVADASDQLKQPGKALGALADALQRHRELARADPDSYPISAAELLTRIANLSRKLTAPREPDAIRVARHLYHDTAKEDGTQRDTDAEHTDAEHTDTTTPSASTDPGEPSGPSLFALSDLSVRLWKLGERDAALHAAQAGRRLATADSAGDPAPAKPMAWEPITDHDPLPQLPQPTTRASAAARGPLGLGTFGLRMDAWQYQSLADEFDTRAFRLLISGQAHESREASLEAIRCAEQAVEIYRQLADTQPSAYLGGLAGALDLLAKYLRKVDSRQPEAEDAAREAHDIRRLLGPPPQA
jgi:tetratricopeptide (TPR) repeat protein